MIFNSFQREDDDSVFTVARNVSGAAFAVGDAAVWDVGASVDGVRISTAAAATVGVFRGIVAEAIADSAYGKVQVHGYCSTAKVSNDTSVSIAAGNILVCTADDAVLIYSAASDGKTGFVYAAEDYAAATTPAAAAKKVLIRAL